MAFDDLKEFNGKHYSGMRIGDSHVWDYNNAVWEETKITPDLWQIKFGAIKGRKVAAPEGSGVPLNTLYHWFIMADQRVIKIDKDSYQTLMEGAKFKIGHKRPYWKNMSYAYPGRFHTGSGLSRYCMRRWTAWRKTSNQEVPMAYMHKWIADWVRANGPIGFYGESFNTTIRMDDAGRFYMKTERVPIVLPIKYLS